MSRRPQEPPRSVSRYHRLTSLKTSGIVARLMPEHVDSQYIPSERNSRRSIKALRASLLGAGHARPGIQEVSREKIRKTTLRRFVIGTTPIVQTDLRMLLCSHLPLNRTAT